MTSVRMTRLFLLAGAGLAVACSNALAQSDPFRWLEPPHSPAALKWAAEQTNKTNKELSAWPNFTTISAQLKRSLREEPPPQFFVVGPHLLRFSRTLAQPYGMLAVADVDRDGAPGAWRTVIDMDALRASEGKRVVFQNWNLDTRCAPPDYNRCLFGFSQGGSDNGVLREFDLRTGKFVEHGFRAPSGRSLYAWLDRDTILISSNAVNGPRTTSGYSTSVRLWKRGTPLSAAPVIWQGKAADSMIEVSSVGTGAHRQGVIREAVDLLTTYRYFLVSPGKAIRPLELPPRAYLYVGATARHLIFQTTRPVVIGGGSVPTNTVVAYDTTPSTPRDHRLSIVYAPRPGEFVIHDGSVPQIATTRSTVNLVVMSRLIQRPIAATFRKHRWTIERGEAVPIGTTVGYVSADSAGDDYIEITTGFTVPTRYDYVRAEGRIITLYQQQAAFDASGDVVEAHRVKSADGTSIDYYLIRPRKIVHLGSVPTLVTGYGGFDVTIQPRYLGGREEGLWLSDGGALAVACIRGGGDRGEAWHQAAMGVNRQRSFDDFLAVTADLEHGFTSPKHLGAFGSSNAGLLVATVGIERPDMYGAIASDVPLTDMLRYTDMGEGWIWTAEFGDSRDPAVRAALLRYSPYQNVREGVKYPPFMITTSTQDNRVGPGHARKFAARLEAVGAPVYFYEESEGGHGVSDPLERPELVSFEATFLIDELMPRSRANGE